MADGKRGRTRKVICNFLLYLFNMSFIDTVASGKSIVFVVICFLLFFAGDVVVMFDLPRFYLTVFNIPNQ